jgi:hypothetical protein
MENNYLYVLLMLVMSVCSYLIFNFTNMPYISLIILIGMGIYTKKFIENKLK